MTWWGSKERPSALTSEQSECSNHSLTQGLWLEVGGATLSYAYTLYVSGMLSNRDSCVHGKQVARHLYVVLP